MVHSAVPHVSTSEENCFARVIGGVGLARAVGRGESNRGFFQAARELDRASAAHPNAQADVEELETE